jgi:hypothetical protein
MAKGDVAAVQMQAETLRNRGIDPRPYMEGAGATRVQTPTPAAAPVGRGIPAGTREAQVIGEEAEARRLAEERAADMTLLKNAPSRLKNLSAIEKNAVEAPYGIKATAGEWMEKLNIPSIAEGKYMPEGYTQYKELVNQTGELLTELLANKLYGKDLSKQELEDAQKKIVDPASSPATRMAVARQIRQRIEDSVAAAARRQGIENPISPVPGPRSSAEEGRGLPEGYWNMTAGGAVSDAMPEQPPINIKTGVRHPSMDPDYEARQLREANSPRHLITGIGDAGSNAIIGLTQMLPDSANSVLARTMSLLPGVNITPEDIKLGEKGSSWKAEKSRQLQEGRDKTFYDTGQLIGDFATGLAIPGGVTVKGVTGGALASGALQPATGSFDRMTNMATSALFGNLFRAATKGEAPRFKGEDAEWKQSRADYFGITPSKEQAAPSSVGAAFQRAEDLSNPAYLDQARAITTKAKVVAGMDPREPLSNVSIERHKKDLGREYENLFTKTQMAPLAPEDARKLIQTVQDFPITENMINAGAARNIQRLQNYIANIDPNRIDFVDMRLLHEAWKEVNKVTSEFGASKQAAKNLKDQISTIMERGIGPDGVKDFRNLNNKYATTLDIETMFNKGEGSGSGVMSGVLLPSKILAVTPKIGTSRLGEEIVETISKLPIKDFKPLEVGISSPLQSVRALGRAAVDAVGRKDIPYTGKNAAIIRELRREAPMFGRELSENIFNQ